MYTRRSQYIGKAVVPRGGRVEPGLGRLTAQYKKAPPQSSHRFDIARLLARRDNPPTLLAPPSHPLADPPPVLRNATNYGAPKQGLRGQQIVTAGGRTRVQHVVAPTSFPRAHTQAYTNASRCNNKGGETHMLLAKGGESHSPAALREDCRPNTRRTPAPALATTQLPFFVFETLVAQWPPGRSVGSPPCPPDGRHSG